MILIISEKFFIIAVVILIFTVLLSPALTRKRLNTRLLGGNKADSLGIK